MFVAGVDPSVRAHAGVALLISPRLTSCVVQWSPHSGRVASLRLRLPVGKTLAVAVLAYAPNAEAEYSTFLAELDDCLLALPSTDSVMILGDFNAHVGNDIQTWGSVIGRHGDAHLNHNGEHLLDFCSGNGLLIMNSWFQHRDIHKYTWYRDVLNQKSIIDFIIVSSDLRSQVQDVRVMRGAELSTDHHLVVGTLYCSGRRPFRKRGTVSSRVRWEALKDPLVGEQLSTNLSSRYRTLPPEVANVDSEWRLFRDALLDEAAKVCGTKRIGSGRDGRRITAWWSDEVQRAVMLKKAHFKRWLGHKSQFNRLEYQNARRAAARAVKAAVSQWWERFGCELSSDYHSALKAFWSRIKQLRKSDRGTCSQHVLLDKRGQIVTGDKAVLDRWKEHFEDLLNPTSASPPIPELQVRAETRLTAEDTRRVVARLKLGKSAGVDEIRPELLKALDGTGIDWLTRVFQVA